MRFFKILLVLLLTTFVIPTFVGFTAYLLGCIDVQIIEKTGRLFLNFNKLGLLFAIISVVLDVAIYYIFRDLFKNKEEFVRFYIINLTINIFFAYLAAKGVNSGLCTTCYHIGKLKVSTFKIFTSSFITSYENLIYIISLPTILFYGIRAEYLKKKGIKL